MRAARFSILTSVILLMPLGSMTASADPVALDVRFKLTDLDYKPVASVPVRLVFGSDPRWQDGDSGQSFVTDADGEARLSSRVAIEKSWKRAPSLISFPQRTDHLMAAVELPYMTFRWLYVVDIFRFPGGDVLLDGFSVYTRDDKGRFTQKAVESDAGWRVRDLGGLLLTRPGYQCWDHTLETDAARQHWTMKLAFKRSPPPVRR